MIEKETPILEKFDFLDLEINEPFNYRILLKNNSGIRTTFRLGFKKFGALEAERSSTQLREPSTTKTIGGGSTFRRSISKAFTITSE